MRRFFVSATQIHDSRALISDEEFHHLRNVLRLQVGTEITLCDDQGMEYRGTIVALSPTSAEVMIRHTQHASVPRLSLTLTLGLLKGQKMDLVIEKVTELGVDCIAPFTSTFTVSQLPQERQHERLSRWQRIAKSAAKQSGSVIPQILSPQTFDPLVRSQPPDTITILFYEHERETTLKAFANDHPHISSLRLIIGPEGGFAPQEIELARREGIHILGLGPQILRAETASIAAVALCRFLWDDVAVPPLPQR